MAAKCYVASFICSCSATPKECTHSVIRLGQLLLQQGPRMMSIVSLYRRCIWASSKHIPTQFRNRCFVLQSCRAWVIHHQLWFARYVLDFHCVLHIFLLLAPLCLIWKCFRKRNAAVRCRLRWNCVPEWRIFFKHCKRINLSNLADDEHLCIDSLYRYSSLRPGNVSRVLIPAKIASTLVYHTVFATNFSTVLLKRAFRHMISSSCMYMQQAQITQTIIRRWCACFAS